MIEAKVAEFLDLARRAGWDVTVHQEFLNGGVAATLAPKGSEKRLVGWVQPSRKGVKVDLVVKDAADTRWWYRDHER